MTQKSNDRKSNIQPGNLIGVGIALGAGIGTALGVALGNIPCICQKNIQIKSLNEVSPDIRNGLGEFADH